MTKDEFYDAILSILSVADFHVDDEGQIVIFTGAKFSKDGNVVPLASESE